MTPTAQQIILASQSQQRKNIFQTLHLPFEIIPADIDELAIKGETEPKRAQKIARKKAEKIAIDYPEAVIFAADTYVFNQDHVLEKPANTDEAKKMLSYMSEQELQAVTGYCCIAEGRIVTTTNVVTTFRFRKLTSFEIDYFVANEPVTTWSAAFAPAYDSGMSLVESVSGSFTSFTHGLPMELVVKDLEQLAIL